jgi:hypothetical protein
MSAGKGDKLRAGANLDAYWSNYDDVFRKRKTIKQWQCYFNDAIIDQTAFEQHNSEDLLTEQEYKKLQQSCT